MNKTTFFLLGAAVGSAVAYLYLSPGTTGMTGSNGLDDVASKAIGWGSKQRATGTGHEVLGKIKQGFGEATGNDQLANEGLVEQAKGAVKDAAGKAVHAAVDVMQDANR